ncbi:hypothetical protein BCV69DRAFT_90954 [Microstroma glucosiphilum]|uniref:Uncharacterized protein n=1 Tax=Pseudomicrostroma glucosiphilum TaxID=1684307 RepID=A0A316TWZ7_9BASI|nr:hypothetical protein BCV69DRAFT_90954 [Pseudomicrostroma glucosiphilum]PWN17996.1 hypothetical protein BCV69DRAFT_90954 [Pseudomicrostroma glucosiphilum]
MHFLEAGFAVDPEAANEASGSSGSSSGSPKISRGEKIRQALLDCSLLDALGGEVESEKTRKAMLDKAQTSPTPSSSQAVSSPAEQRLASLRKSLAESDDEARSETFRIYTRSGLDDAESLLMAEGMLAPDRDWFIPNRRSDAEGPAVIGLQSSLARVGDYLREKGPFHIGIGSGSGYEVLRLVSALLKSAASSSDDDTQAMQPVLSYPLLFPLLPLTAPAPRMGGWEVLPSLPLPNGRRRALCQSGMHVLVRMGEGVPVLKEEFWQGERKKWQDTGAGESKEEQKVKTWRIGLLPLTSTSSKGQEATSSTSSDEHLLLSPSSTATAAANSATLLTSSTTAYLASTLRKLCFHLEVVPGLEPAEARAVARARAREEAQEEEKRRQQGGSAEGEDGVQIERDSIGPFLRERARQDAMEERQDGKI